MIRSKKVLRVGVLNNFNHTDAEIEQVKKLSAKWNVFVNSNAKTSIRYGPCIVTVNPDLDKFIEPTGDISKIAAARIKVIADPCDGPSVAMEQAYVWCQAHDIPVLLTAMRFPSGEMLGKFTKNPNLYEWKNSYYRIRGWRSIKAPLSAYYCDKDHLGCPSCKNCALLACGDSTLEIYGINLSSSGLCPYNCPGCFARKCLQMTKLKLPLFDKPFRNKKQRGLK